MDDRNHRTIEYASLTNDPDARNRRNLPYVPHISSDPYAAYATRKNPPAPPRDAVQDRLGALQIYFNEALRDAGL